MLFLSHSPRLTIRRPSSTTIEYTVSTASPLSSPTSYIVFALLTLLRLVAALFCASLVLTKYHASTSLSLSSSSTSISADDDGELAGFVTALATLLLRTPLGRRAHDLSAGFSWYTLAPLVLFALYLVSRRGYTEESLLVLRGLGIQTSTSSPSYLSTTTSRFIPTELVQDIFIHEAFVGFEVRFYLAAVVKAEEKVVVVFPVSPDKYERIDGWKLIDVYSNYYRNDKYWRRYGGEQGNVYMLKSRSF
jgi:phosphatidylinositol glycan class H protein